MKKILTVSSTGQSLVKTAALDKAITRYNKKSDHFICHIVRNDSSFSVEHYTGLKLPDIDHSLFIDNDNDVLCMAHAMTEFEKVLRETSPDIILLTGFEDITLSCALTASRMKIPLAHTDSGLRSFDRNNIEEINRIIIDVFCKYHFVSEHSGMKNLRDEGLDNQNIFFTGNLLADTLNECWEKIESGKPAIINKMKNGDDYVLFAPSLTFNYDNIEVIRKIFEVLKIISRSLNVFVVLSGRAEEILRKEGIIKLFGNKISILSQLNYLDFLSLMYRSRLVITDNTSIQEETTYLGVQCVTVMNYTERPVTIDVGTNHLAGTDRVRVERIINDILDGIEKPVRLPENWDGKTGERIAEIIC